MNGAVSKVTKKFISHLKFRMRYQQFTFHAYCGAPGSVYKMAQQQKKTFCVLRFEVSRSVITVQRAVQCTVITATSYQQFAFHAYCGAAGSVSKMASQPRSKHDKRTAGSA
jgi:hypothetical protein